MRKLFFAIAAVLLLLSIPTVNAHCPLCSAAVGAGVAVTRFYGVDDTIAGVWIGAFVISTAVWFGRVLKKKYIPFQNFFIAALALILTIVTFYFAGLIGNAQYRIFGVDKLLLGMVAGSIVAWLGVLISDKIRAWKGRILFPFQTIAIILALLVLASAACWIATGFAQA